jgi:hypothetical protein
MNAAEIAAGLWFGGFLTGAGAATLFFAVRAILQTKEQQP